VPWRVPRGCPLGEGLGRDQADLTSRVEQSVHAKHEVRDEVGAASDAVADLLDEVLAVGRAE